MTTKNKPFFSNPALETAVASEAKRFGGVLSGLGQPFLVAAGVNPSGKRHLIFRFETISSAERFRSAFKLGKVRTTPIGSKAGPFVRVKLSEFKKVISGKPLQASGKPLQASTFGGPVAGESPKEFSKRRGGLGSTKRGL